MKEYKLPETLRKYMKDNELTRHKMVCKLDIAPRTLDDWLSFKSTPSLFSLMSIAEATGLTLEALVYGEEN